MANSDEARLISMRMLQNFVRQNKGKWTPDAEKKLLERVKKAGFAKVQPARIKQLMEDNRERWLSGDNSVGAPPAASKKAKAASKAQAPSGGSHKEKEKNAMPEQKKPGQKKPEPTKPTAAKPAPAPVGGAKPEAKKDAKGGVPANAPALNPKDGSITEGQAQEQHQRRLALLKSSQDLTKESMEAEVAIRKHEGTLAELQRKLKELDLHRQELDEQRKQLQAEVDTVSTDVKTFRSDVDAAHLKSSTLEEDVGKKKKERSEHIAAIASFKSDKEGLIS